MPQYSYANYNANGVTTQFTIPFAYLAQSHVRVFVSNVEKILGVDFTIDTGTNKVVFGVAPGSGTVVTLRRITPRSTDERTVDFSSGAGLQEQDLDDSALQNLFIEQELLDDNQSTLRGPVSDGTINEIPVKAVRADKVQAYDGAGQPIAITKEAIVLGGNAEASDSAAASAASAVASANSAVDSANSATSSANSATASAASATAAAASAVAAAASVVVSVAKAGDTMTGPLVVPAGATGSQVPRVSEVVAKTGDHTMTGSLTLPNTITSALNGGQLAGFRNLIINGRGAINQRAYVSGTATTGANQYTLDRWRVVTSGQNLTFSTSGVTTTMTAPAGGLEQVIEGVNIAGGTYVINWTGTATCTIDGVAKTKGATVVLTAGTNSTVRFSSGTVTDVQLEPGTVATPYEARPIHTELSACSRYYQRIVGISSASYALSGYFSTSTTAVFPGRHPIEMRASPTITATPTTYCDNAGTNIGATYSTGASNTHSFFLFFTVSGATAGRGTALYMLDANTRISFSAEL